MKFYLLLLTSLICFTAFSQSPPLINYQGVARNAAGVPIINQNIGIKFELLQGSISGAVVYTEQQPVTTNSLGLFTTQIGAVNPLTGINWQNGPYFLQISMDAAGGTSYTFLGTQQLVSVPYALFAQKAGSAPSPTIAYIGNVLSVGGNTTTINSGVYSAGNGINISGGVISNTAVPSITLTGSGLANVSPSVSSVFNINVPNQTLSLTSGSVLSSNLGGSVALPLTTISSGTNIAVLGNAVSGYTINNTAPGSATTSLIVSNTNIQLLPGLNSYTLNPYSYSISANSNTLTLSNGAGGSITTATVPLTTITPSNGIAVSGNSIIGYTIANTAIPSISFTNATTGTIFSGSGGSSGFTIPSPIITGGSGVAVSGVWPAITISALSSGTMAGWSTLGNTGTNASSNFIGTTDNQNLVFRTNNLQQAVITSAGNVGIGSPAPSSKLVVNGTGTVVAIDASASNATAINAFNNSGTAPTINAINSGAGAAVNVSASGGGIGIVVNSTIGNAITGISNGGTPTIYGKNNGSGSGIEAENALNGSSLQAYKNSGTGSAALFSNTSAGNSAPVVNVSTSAGNNGINISASSGNAINANNNSGTAPAIVANNTGAGNGIDINMPGSGPTALQLNNGHIKSIGASPTYFNNAIAGGFTTPTAVTISGTDVKGKFSFSTSATGFSALNYCDVTFSFAKVYTTPPTVVAVPTIDTFGLAFMISNTTGSSFTIRIYRSSNLAIPSTVSSTTFGFNYIVIE